MTATSESPHKKLRVGQFFRDYIVLSGGQVFSKLLGFAIFAYLARILTVSEYGAVETVVGMSLIGYKVVELGTGSIAVRWIAQGAASLRDAIGAVVSARALIALIVVPILGLSYSAAAGADLPMSLIWLFALSLFAAPFAHEWLFQAHEKMGIAAFGPLLRMLVFVGAVLLFSPRHHGVVMIGCAEIASLIAVALFFSGAARVSLGARNPNYSIRAAIKLASQSAPLGASAFLNSFGLYGPVLVVTAIAGGEQAGWFGAAHRIVASAITFSFIYYFNVYPLFSRLLQHDPKRLQAFLDASSRVTAWAGVAAALGMWTIGGPLMTLIFGAEFSEAGAIFRILVWMLVFELISGNARWLLVAAHRQMSLAFVQAVGAAFSILLAYLLADHWGGKGAAIAIVCANASIWLAAQMRTQGLAARPPIRPIIPPILAGGAIFTLLSFWRPDPIIAAVVAGVSMAAFAFMDRKLMPALRSLAAAKNKA